MRRTRLWKAFWVLVLVLVLASPGRPTRAQMIIVSNTNDSGGGSLRQAIEDANQAGSDVIFFDIGGCSGVCVIQPTSALPALTDDGTIVAGYSQPGAAQATDTTPATIMVQIDGTNAGSAYGLYVTSSENDISGLSITNFEWDGIRISGSGVTGNVVWGNHIGCDAAGTTDQGNVHDGVYIGGSASGNTVGGDTPGERNVISGNDSDGVSIQGSDTMSNTVSGNYIGTNITGTVALGNAENGVNLANGARSNTVGGDTPGERNVISGNDSDGVSIQGSDTMSNTVSGNYIGTNITGTVALSNTVNGVNLANGARSNTVGGDTPGERNVISGNGTGVTIQGGATMSNTVSGNYIGTDVTGALGLGNTDYGVSLDGGANGNLIGGDTPGERNVISRNGYGIYIQDEATTSNTVSGNYVGTDITGILCLGNSGGVRISQGSNNTIGGDRPGEGNVISCNYYDGVYVGGSNNVVLGNYIGTGANGTEALGNKYGVTAHGTSNTVGPGNIIAHNTFCGVENHFAVITQNCIYANAGDGIDNMLFWPVPTILTATLGLPVEITGTALAGWTVEVFENGDADGEGETYVGSAVADPSGAFTVVVSGLDKPYLTATMTDLVVEGTSKFSEVFTSGTRSNVLLPVVLRDHVPH